MVAVVVSGGVKHEVMLYWSWDAVHQLSTLDRRTELCDMNINMDDLLCFGRGSLVLECAI